MSNNPYTILVRSIYDDSIISDDEYNNSSAPLSGSEP